MIFGFVNVQTIKQNSSMWIMLCFNLGKLLFLACDIRVLSVGSFESRCVVSSCIHVTESRYDVR